MTPPETPDDLERLFESVVETYDEQLATGDEPSTLDGFLPIELQSRWHGTRRCLALLDELRQTAEESAGNVAPASSLECPGTPNQLGRFELREEIGGGAHGMVYRAIDLRLSREVALKLPRIEVLTNRAARERFLREARAAGALSHANIVSIYEVGEVAAGCFIVAELIWFIAYPVKYVPPGSEPISVETFSISGCRSMIRSNRAVAASVCA